MNFADDYFSARQRFRELAAGHGWELEAQALDARGPNGEELTLDAAWHGRGETALVVSSGLHGVEGFFGSAVQQAALERWPTPPDGVRWLFLHALNPFGFAHLRRANEDNVDPNRNFLLAGQGYRGCAPIYPRLDPLLNPRRPPSVLDAFPLRAAWAILRHGMPALKQAVAGGQYDFPQGLFYGGAAPCQTVRLLQAHLGRWLGDARRVLHFDVHTGLGRWATWKLLADDPLTPARAETLSALYGRDAIADSVPDGLSYLTRGSFGSWCVATFPERDYTYLCLEFGTYPPLRVLAGLRAENQVHHWGRPDSLAGRRAKARLRELFCPAALSWRQHSLEQALAVIGSGGEALIPGHRREQT